MILVTIPAVTGINIFFTIKVIFSGTEDEGFINDLPDPVLNGLVTGWNLFIAIVLPFITITISNILIIYGIRRAANKRQEIARVKSSSKEAHLTRMLVLVSVVFIILCLPDGVLRLIMTIPDVIKHYDYTQLYWRTRHRLIGYTMYDLALFNNAVNFYLYVLGGGRTFREDVKKAFTGCFQSNARHNHH